MNDMNLWHDLDPSSFWQVQDYCLKNGFFFLFMSCLVLMKMKVNFDTNLLRSGCIKLVVRSSSPPNPL